MRSLRVVTARHQPARSSVVSWRPHSTKGVSVPPRHHPIIDIFIIVKQCWSLRWSFARSSERDTYCRCHWLSRSFVDGCIRTWLAQCSTTKSKKTSEKLLQVCFVYKKEKKREKNTILRSTVYFGTVRSVDTAILLHLLLNCVQ